MCIVEFLLTASFSQIALQIQSFSVIQVCVSHSLYTVTTTMTVGICQMNWIVVSRI